MTEEAGTVRKAECPDKRTFIEEIKQVILDIVETQNENFQAVMHGKLHKADVTGARLARLQKRRESLMERFRTHLSNHGC